MKLSIAAPICLLFATAVSAESFCGSTPDCCWKDLEACEKKLGGRCFAGARFQTEKGHFCQDNNVTLAQCDADCCSVSRKVGIGC
ncbi:uncharacterized protein LY79DRAFT_277241 [Colletotrichum navitas]|uniref:Uncharacterized protein n=1 Tax=Colletotrichum navitas TaxID=681940 RepID=A0AAD8PW20_9PEZI|nr:uncharacterized protein LY79DRAFT_277241 [Colletotrichum navitas]KAK1585014.1 hypothetical protein LY79DRAFT_277241 [Colletotrichum navitas]